MALIKREYEKREPFRDAVILIIICEGEQREPDYFRFFNKLSSRLKIIPVPSEDGKSAPSFLTSNANKAEAIYNSDSGDYELWFVLDTDRWGVHIHTLQNDCSTKDSWRIALSNPCFEVWLYYHFNDKLPGDTNQFSSCKKWKQHIPEIKKGGFNSTKHPRLISTAIINSKTNYSGNGYLPNVGSTQLHLLGEKIYDLTKSVLD